MRTLCLFLPRFGIQLLYRERPRLQGKEVVLLQGCGDAATVAGASVPGVACGSSAGQARRAASDARFLPDNASDCLDELDRLAAIVRRSATPLVEVGGRDHLFVDMDGLKDRFGSEGGAAARLAGLLQECTRFRIRAAVADTRAAAVEAARAARLQVHVLETGLPDPEEVVPSRDESLTVSLNLPQGEPNAKRAVARQLSRVADVMGARDRGFRRIRVQLQTRRAPRTLTLRPAIPMYSRDDVLRALEDVSTELDFTGAHHVSIACDGPAPDVRVTRATATPREVKPQVRRRRQPYLRATA